MSGAHPDDGAQATIAAVQQFNEAEEIFAAGDRCVVRWVYHWVREGKPGHVRGVDLFRVADGRVAEKLSYVKG